MAEQQLIRNDRVQAEARDTDWATLIGRAVDDMTRIVHSELRLLSAGMKIALDQEVDRVMALVATFMLMAGGALCVLAAVILFLHEFAGLPWWQSFGLTGLGLFAIAIAVGAFAGGRAPTPSTNLE